MPAKQQNKTSADRAPSSSDLEKVVANENLLATETEREATSKSLYSDFKARISSNLSTVRDRTRNSAFNAAFVHSLKGKTVLHIGCGMGLLSMMAARAGASFVVGVDSSTIIHTATELAKRNNLENVHFVQGKMQEGNVELPTKNIVDSSLLTKMKDNKFDAVVCEWMGSFITNDELYTELEYCVKNHLAAGGIVCPNRAQLHAVALSDYNYRSEMCDYWDNVYGFQMHSMRPLVQHEATSGHIPRDCVVTKPTMVHQLDLSSTAASAAAIASSGSSATTNTDSSSASGNIDLTALKKYSSDFKLTVEKKCSLHFLTFYLSASFADKEHPRGNFILGFALGESRNAFQEVSLTLPTPIPVFAGDELEGNLKVTPIKHQYTEVELTVRCNNAALPEGYELKEKYVFQY